jgi:hypothetical protein
MEAVQTSETLVNSYQSTRRYNPEVSHLQCGHLLHSRDHSSLGDSNSSSEHNLYISGNLRNIRHILTLYLELSVIQNTAQTVAESTKM